MHCRNCGAEVQAGAAVCLKCGFNPKSQRNFCGHCGAATQAAQVVCVKCGHSLKGSVFGGAQGGAAAANALGGYLNFFQTYPWASFALVLLFVFLPYVSVSGMFGGSESLSPFLIATQINFGSFLGVLVCYIPAIIGLVLLLKAPGDAATLRTSLGLAVAGLAIEILVYLVAMIVLKNQGGMGSMAASFVSPGAGFWLTNIVYGVHVFSVKQVNKN